MNQAFKKMLITGASLLMLTGVGAGVGQMAKPAHASAAWSAIYHSKRTRHNVYYALDKNDINGLDHFNHYVYGRMPKGMRKPGYKFALYHGKEFYKINNFSKHEKFPSMTLHRHGQTYYFDYFATEPKTMKYRGHKYYIIGIYVNKKDVGRLVKPQRRAEDHFMPKAYGYTPVHSHKHGKRVVRRHHKHMVKRNHARRHGHKRARR